MVDSEISESNGAELSNYTLKALNYLEEADQCKPSWQETVVFLWFEAVLSAFWYFGYNFGYMYQNHAYDSNSKSLFLV